MDGRWMGELVCERYRMLGLGIDSISSVPCSIGVVKRRGINYCFEYT